MKDDTEKMRTDALTLLRAIDARQAHGQSGARVDLPRAARDVELEVGSKCYHDALSCLIDKGALAGDEHTEMMEGPRPHAYALYLFTRRAPQLLHES